GLLSKEKGYLARPFLFRSVAEIFYVQVKSGGDRLHGVKGGRFTGFDTLDRSQAEPSDLGKLLLRPESLLPEPSYLRTIWRRCHVLVLLTNKLTRADGTDNDTDPTLSRHRSDIASSILA